MGRLFPWISDHTKGTERARTTPDRAQVLMQEAAAALERKDTAAARAFYTESISLFETRKMWREEADALHALAQMLVSQCDYAAAFDAYARAIELYRKLNTRGLLAVTLRDAGYASTDCGNLDAARQFLTESLSLFEATSDRCGAASALEGLGIVSLESKELSLATDSFNRSLALHRELGLNPESAVSLIYLSTVALSKDDIRLSETLYRESIDRFKADNPESSLVPPLLTVGDVAYATNDSIQIAELLQAALAVFGASRLKRSWDSAMERLGGVAQRRNVSRSKIETYKHSFSIDPARDEWGAEAIACLGLGCVAYRQDRPKIGKTLIARSMNLCRLHGDSDTVLYVLSYAAAYTYSCQHYPDCRQYHVQCADVARNAGDLVQVADAMCYAAFLSTWLGEFEDARKYSVEAISIYRNYGFDADRIRTQSLLATIFCQLGDVETGSKIHDEAIVSSRRLGDPICIALALASYGTAITRVDSGLARKCLTESLELLEAPTLQTASIHAEVMHNMGELERLEGKYVTAYGYFCGSLQLKLEENDRYGSAMSLVGCSLIASALGFYEQACLMLYASASLRQKIGMPILAPLKIEAQSALDSAEACLGKERVADLKDFADTMTLGAAIEAAWSLEPEIH